MRSSVLVGSHDLSRLFCLSLVCSCSLRLGTTYGSIHVDYMACFRLTMTWFLSLAGKNTGASDVGNTNM